MFLLSIDLMGSAFKLLNRDIVESILNLTSNPFISLFIGLLITALIQSSSTSTSMIVTLVASGSIGISEAIPMIMGANVGTTITSTLVSLSFITKKDEFRKAISAGLVHDFFNILTVIILFPLEYYYGLLSQIAIYLTEFFTLNGISGEGSDISYTVLTSLVSDFVVDLLPYPLILVILAFILLASSIKLLAKKLYKSVTGDSREVLKKYFFSGPYKSFLWGLGITAVVQSSSVTTSGIIPFVATRKISVKQAFNFILGANIGTTLTALIVALFNSEAAISVALIHLIFNLIGVLIVLPFPEVRKIPVRLAKRFGRLTMNYRLLGFFYIIFTFFLLPFFLISINNYTNEEETLVYEVNDYVANDNFEKHIVVKKSGSDNLYKMFEYDAPVNQEEIAGKADHIFEVYRRKNMLIWDHMVFPFTENQCWENTDSVDSFKICSTKKLDTIMFNASRSVVVFEKLYSHSKSVQERYYFDEQDKLLLKREILNVEGELIKTEVIKDRLE